MLAKADTLAQRNTGTAIVLGGLGIQIGFFGLFIVTTIIFDLRMRRRPTARSFQVVGDWKQLIAALYISSLLVMVRSVFRMIEFGMGNDSVLMSNEGYLLGLDGALMLLVAAVLLWSHPSRALAGYKEVLASSGGESGRNTAESFQMLPVHPDVAPAGAKMPGKYDSDSTAVMGGQGSGYEVPAWETRYSSAYGR